MVKSKLRGIESGIFVFHHWCYILVVFHKSGAKNKRIH